MEGEQLMEAIWELRNPSAQILDSLFADATGKARLPAAGSPQDT